MATQKVKIVPTDCTYVNIGIFLSENKASHYSTQQIFIITFVIT